MQTRLECGHTVDLEVGTRVYNYYDCGFGVLVVLDTFHQSPTRELWHTYKSEGAAFWQKDNRKSLDASRIVCESCGERKGS